MLIIIHYPFFCPLDFHNINNIIHSFSNSMQIILSTQISISCASINIPFPHHLSMCDSYLSHQIQTFSMLPTPIAIVVIFHNNEVVSSSMTFPFNHPYNLNLSIAHLFYLFLINFFTKSTFFKTEHPPCIIDVGCQQLF